MHEPGQKNEGERGIAREIDSKQRDKKTVSRETEDRERATSTRAARVEE